MVILSFDQEHVRYVEVELLSLRSIFAKETYWIHVTIKNIDPNNLTIWFDDDFTG